MPTERVEEILTIKEVCLELKVSKHTVYGWINNPNADEQLRAIRPSGGRLYRVWRRDLMDFLTHSTYEPEENWQGDLSNDE